MTKQELERKLSFLDLTDDDLSTLRQLRPVFKAHAHEFVDAFYRHLLSFEETRGLLRDPEVKRRLLEKQRAYLIRLGDGVIDEDYVEERVRIGETHVRVGLEPGWYLGAYALYLKLLVPIISEHHRHDLSGMERSLIAIHKVLMLDSQLAMEAYIRGREHQLEYLNRELSDASRELRKVYDRQATELRQTSQRAQAAEELASIATLVAGLAHEIGTPMGVIQGHAELLESSVSDERGRWRLQTIRDQIERISHIIQTLLNMARPHTPEHTAVDLEALIRSSLAFLSEKFRSRGITTDFEAVSGVSIKGDHEKLQQLFLNLFLNAADAMPSGGQLVVSMQKLRSGSLCIRIRDTGQGMPETVRSRIFEPFFTTKEAGRGSGLGLMVAGGIVRDHGGNIEVDSEEGKGTEFVLTFPLPSAPGSDNES